MNKKIISIITDWNPTLGQGHIQRMLSLVQFINKQETLKAYIINDKIPGFIKEDNLKNFFSNNIIDNTSLIIRDLRDSTKKEISHLKKLSKVLVIDDVGDGRNAADYQIDLLPNKLNFGQFDQMFLFGYNFINTISSIKKINNDHLIDLVIYPGSVLENRHLKMLLSKIPKKCRVAVLAGKKSYIIENSIEKKLRYPYAETIFSSRVVLSHFGITIFEANLAGCKILSLNPSEYHSELTEILKEKIDVKNYGLWKNIDNDIIDAIIDEINNASSKKIIYEEVEEKINNYYNNFNNLILKCINK